MLLYGVFVAPAALAGVDFRSAAFLALCPFLMLALPAGLSALGLWGWRAGWALYGIWSLGWVLGYAVQVFLALRYGLGPLDVPVVEALAHTTAQESREFVSDLGWVSILLLGLLVPLGSGLLAAGMARLVLPRPVVVRNRLLALCMGLIQLAVVFILHNNPLIERANPVTLARIVFGEARQLQSETTNIHAFRQRMPDHLRDWKPVYRGSAQKTVVLVLGESSNRWDWSLYGYSRETNPRLQAIRPELLVFTDVVSSFGSTATELTRILTPADALSDHDWQNQPSVINLARAAGYKTFWITNQSFPFANALFGDESDRHVSVYTGRIGRHDASLDEKLLPPLNEALSDPAPRKLIVLHMLGSHPDYAERYTEAFDRFGKSADAVDRTMSHRWPWVRWRRAQYDNSILYTDHLLASVIARLKQDPVRDESLVFLSDHAQDVGHLTGSWGHQFHLESGFTVPLLLWRKGERLDQSLAGRPYQTDRFDMTLLPLLGIHTARDQPEFDLLGPRFQTWQRRIDGRDYVPGVSHRPDGDLDIAGR